MAEITLAGEALIADLQAQELPLNIDQIVFANIAGLDAANPVNRAETMPAAQDIVAQELITDQGVVNQNTVVYSMVLPSTTGTWSFNWMGLYCSEHDTIVAIAYTPIQEKRATVGLIVGNILTKNFAVEFNGASELTGINIDAASWQIDYTARLLAMDKLQRECIKTMYGDAAFMLNAFKAKYQNTKYYLTAGEAVIGGLRVSLSADVEVVPTTLPNDVWLDVYQVTTMAGIVNTVDIIINDGTLLTDYSTGGVDHSLIKVATINSSVNIVDHRAYLVNNLELYHKGNMPAASLSLAGIVKLTSSLTNPSESDAASAKAVKLLKDYIDGINDVLSSNDASLDTLQEVVNFIKQNRSDLDSLGISAISGLQTALDAKAAASHSHASGDLPSASLVAKGVVQLNNNLISNSTTEAATANTVFVLKGYIDNINTILNSGTSTLDTLQEIVNYIQLNRSDLDSLGISNIAGLQTALNGKAALSHTHTQADLPSGSTTVKGLVQLSSSTTSTSTTLAATPSAVKIAKDAADVAQTTANAKAALGHTHPAGDLPTASTTAKGVVQLNDTLTSTNTSLAATANSVKVLKGYIDTINALLLSNDVSLDTLQEIVNYIQLNRSDLDALSIAGVAGLQGALDTLTNAVNSKQAYDADIPTIVVSSVEATAGTSTANRTWTPARVKEAVKAFSNEVAVLTGTIADGGTIPLPSGYTQAQCKWMVSFSNTGNKASNGIWYELGHRCYASTTRVVTCQYYVTETYTSWWESVIANYIIIGVK